MICSSLGCGSTTFTDDYCDTCGLKAETVTGAAVKWHSAATPQTSGRSGPSSSSSPIKPAGTRCSFSGCSGKVVADGYCDTCGILSTVEQSGSPAPDSGADPPSFGAAMAPDASQRIAIGSKQTSGRTRSSSLSSSRTGIGRGLVSVAPTVSGNPAETVMTAEKIQAALGVVAEDERHCSVCGKPVGQSIDGEPGRIQGFCGECRTPFDFMTNEPALEAGELVAGQYEILGPLAHGGLGWIYLARDRAVADRWVVLKGLLNEDDADAVAAAVAERQFLAQLDHANIVNIYNFVTHRGSGYIVMEHIGGESLNDKLKVRRAANGGVHDPLPVAEAIAYVLAVLPAFTYLHDHELVYNDLKPANVMVAGGEVKLIDLGAVMRYDDAGAAIFGTQGFQAPEVASAGPSVASDIYTIGRTLAVLIIRFTFHTGQYEFRLPTPADEPLFQQHESLYRFLLRATAPHPDDRFQTAVEMGDQLHGVLRELASLTDKVVRQSHSTNFEVDQLADLLVSDAEDFRPKEADWRVLPPSVIRLDDPAGTFLAGLPEGRPLPAIRAVQAAVGDQTLPFSQEVILFLIRHVMHLSEVKGEESVKLWTGGSLQFWSGDEVLVHPQPVSALAPVLLLRAEKFDPWDWRVTWYRSVLQLKGGSSEAAATGFSRVWTELPGESAPKLAVALAAEQAGDYGRAAQLYDLVTRTDSVFVSAAFGLARCMWHVGDNAGVVDALNRVPSGSAAFHEAQVAAARSHVFGGPNATPGLGDLRSASQIVQRLQLESTQRANIASDIYRRALEGVLAGRIQPDGKPLLDSVVSAVALRKNLAQTYREQARLTSDWNEKVRLVDLANQVRPRTFL